jgi:hypothetical protein
VLTLIAINVLYYEHTRRHYAFSITKHVHSQQHSKRSHGHDRHRQAKHHKQELFSNPSSSVCTRMPARNPVPLGFASIPRHARNIKKDPLHSPMLSSCKAPATKDARSTPPGPAASSPSTCRSFIAGWPKRLYLSTEKGIKGKQFGSTHAYVARFWWSH